MFYVLFHILCDMEQHFMFSYKSKHSQMKFFTHACEICNKSSGAISLVYLSEAKTFAGIKVETIPTNLVNFSA